MTIDKKNIYSNDFSYLFNKPKILTQLCEGRVFILNEVNSTNQYIIDNIEYVKLGDVVLAEYQTSGRGRYGKIWVAPFGKNICLSIYWGFNYIPISMIEFSLMVSIVVATTLQKLGVSCVKIKWPNDLYINERKLAGILIEIITRKNCITHVIIGIGINLSMCTSKTLETNISENWISLEDIGIILDRDILIAVLINVLRQKLKYFEYYGFKPFIPYWKNFDYLYKKSVILFIKNRSIVLAQGIANGINLNGALIVKQLNITNCYIEDNISVNVL